MQNKDTQGLKTWLKTLKMSFKQVVGWSGAIIIVLAYLFITLNIMSSKTVIYNIFQLAGGILLAIRVWLDKNYSNFILEMFFISIALFALFKLIWMN